MTSTYALHFLSNLGLSTYRKLHQVNIVKIQFMFWFFAVEMRRKRKTKKEREEIFGDGKDKAHREEKAGEKRYPTEEKWWRQWTVNSVNIQQFALKRSNVWRKKYQRVLQKQPTQVSTGSLKDNFIILFIKKGKPRLEKLD